MFDFTYDGVSSTDLGIETKVNDPKETKKVESMVFETWCIHEATDKMKAAEELGLKFDFEKTNIALRGLNYDGKLYTHQEHGYRVTVYW